MCFLWPVPFPGRRLVTLLQVLSWPCAFSPDLLVCSLGRTVAPAPCPLPPTPAGLRLPPSPHSQAAVVPRRELRGARAGGCLRPPPGQACPPHVAAGRGRDSGHSPLPSPPVPPPAPGVSAPGLQPPLPTPSEGQSTFLSRLCPCLSCPGNIFIAFFLMGK